MHNFASPHTHIQSLDTGCKPSDFIRRELELGTGSITCTDHGSLAAARQVYDLAKKNNLTPIIGCLLPGQEIHTIDGMKPVEEVAVGDMVLTHKGRFRRVVRTMSRPFEGDVYTLYQARKGARGITVTGEHPVFVCGQDKLPRWVRADELVAGRNERRSGSIRYGYNTYVMLPRLHGSADTISLETHLRPHGFTFEGRTKSTQVVRLGAHTWKYPRTLNMTQDLAYFLGLYAAEGSASESGHFSLCFATHETEFVSFCVKFLASLGIEAKTYPRPHKGTVEVVACQKPFAVLLRSLCGVGAANKKVPREIVLGRGRQFRERFLDGVLDGDGKKGSSNDLKTTSPDLAWGVRLLAVDLGVFVTPKIAPKYSVKHKRPYYLGIQKKAQWRRAFWVNGNNGGGGGKWLATPLREVATSHYRGVVYNFEVEEDHSYVSDVILHNCEAYFRDDECPLLTKAGIPKTEVEKFAHLGPSFMEYAKYFHFTAHFTDADAFETASRLLSKADLKAEQHGSERKPIFGWNELEELAGTNTTITTGCLIGVVQRHLLCDRPDLARQYYERIRSIVRPGNFFVEVFPHRCHKNFVEAVFFTSEDPAAPRKRFHPKKLLRVVAANGATLDIKAGDLHAKIQESPQPYRLVAVSHYRVWGDVAPTTIVGSEYVNGFVQNECKPWAPDGDSQLGGNKFVLELAREYGDPCLISDDAHFAYPEDKIVQDVRLGQSGAWRFYESYHRQSSADALAYFKEYMGITESEFEGWVENSREWAGRFKDFKFHDRKSLPTKFYPQDTLRHTMELIKAKGRMDWSNAAYYERLKAEIELLHKNGTLDLLPYFFIDTEVVDLYEANNQLTGPGRGSAAGLLTTYLLGITHVDPLKYQLSMDRFMTVDRIKSGKLPDIDQDLPHRDLLVGQNDEGGWLQKRFGDHVAQISTETSMKLKSSIKDVHRALHGTVAPEIHQICKALPDAPQGISDVDFVFGYITSDESVPGIIESEPTLKAYVSAYPAEWKIVVKCLGLVRQRGRHACAYLIANQPVSSFIPLTTVGGVQCTAYPAGSVEAAGGLKMDFLVVNSLKDVQGAIRLIQERHGKGRGLNGGDGFLGHSFMLDGKRVPGLRVVPHGDGNLYDIWDLPEDQSVFREICEGDTETVFQFNTAGARKWLTHFNYEKPDKPGHKAIDSIESLSAFTALDRPGPLDAYVGTGDKTHNMLVEYARRARGEPPTGNMPVLDQLLPETHGVIIYQEQLQQVFQTVGGTDGATANAFREHVAKKKMAEVSKDGEIFLPKASARYGEPAAKAMLNQMVTFGQYGFNKSHSVSYVHISYACAWLKHHYPLEWWCSVLRNADRNEINEKFWPACSRLIELPSLGVSGDDWEIQGSKIRAPLSLLVGMGPKAHEELCAERPFKDIAELCNKLDARAVRLGEMVTKTVVKKKKDRKTGVVTETKSEVPFLQKARSAVNQGTMTKLILSGCADDLFPLNTSTYDKLSAYSYSLAEAKGKKRRDGSIKADAVPEKYLSVDQLVRLQIRKQLLPGYRQQLLPVFLERKIPGVGLREGTYWFMKQCRFLTMDGVRHLNNLEFIAEPVTFAVAAYVRGYSTFQYDQGKKHAAKFLLDVGGASAEFVRWPERKTGRVVQEFEGDPTGSIAIVVLTKFAVGKDPSIDRVVVVQAPFVEPAEDGSQETPEE